MIRHRPSGAALAAIIMLGGCGGGGARVAMEPGEWEMTMRVTNVRMDNLPPEMREETRGMRTNETRTSRNCMTVTADVVRIENLRFAVPGPGPGRSTIGCRIEELAMEGGRISGRMSCDGVPVRTGRTMSMSGELDGSYTARSMDVRARGEVRTGAYGGSAEMRITGRRLGACPAPRSYGPTAQPMPVPMPAPVPPGPGAPIDNGQ